MEEKCRKNCGPFVLAGMQSSPLGLTRIQPTEGCWVDFLDKNSGIPVIKLQSQAERQKEIDRAKREERLKEEAAERKRQEEEEDRTAANPVRHPLFPTRASERCEK